MFSARDFNFWVFHKDKSSNTIALLLVILLFVVVLVVKLESSPLTLKKMICIAMRASRALIMARASLVSVS